MNNLPHPDGGIGLLIQTLEISLGTQKPLVAQTARVFHIRYIAQERVRIIAGFLHFSAVLTAAVLFAC